MLGVARLASVSSVGRLPMVDLTTWRFNGECLVYTNLQVKSCI